MRFTMGLLFLGWVIFLPGWSYGSSYSDSLDSLLQQASSLQYDNTDKAFSLTQKARELLAGNQEPLPMARLNNREATLHYISGNYDRALRHFALAKEFGERADSKKEIVYAINGRALIQMVDKEYPKALQLLEECIAINQEMRDSMSLAKNHFKIIIQNLLGNAIKFTPEYGKIEIFYTVTDQNIGIHIKDSGVGIDEAHQDLINGGVDVRIPFKVGTRGEKGTGLGLLLVKRFLALNGGKMDVTSIPGTGTRFILYFKRRKI